MDIYASDEEKGEEIKQWWRDNGLSVVVACLLGVSVLFGGRYWVTHQNTQAESASNHYQQLISFLADDKKIEAENATQKLLSEFSKTPYAVFAAFEMAKQSLNDNDVTRTKTYLEWVMSNAKLAGQVEIARLRLAQCLFTETNYESALILMEQSESQAFDSLFSELRGDIYAIQGEQSLARTAYQSALLSVNQGEPRQQVLQLKLDDMAGA
ncbi:MAG: tetratricopeptide repeat protein [Piscirickettsiaceae bacterium]|nr:tetratricopeptide repeat protein [Piscirickettsiaceae bacterium]